MADSRWASGAVNALMAVSVLLGVACPGLMAICGPHMQFVAICLFVLPVLWIVRWGITGLWAGILFLWLSAYAIGGTGAGPGEVDNFMPAVMVLFGGVCATVYLVPVYAGRQAIIYLREARRRTDAPAPAARR